MKKRPPPPGASGRNLSKEDRDLWEGTAATLKPLRGVKARVHSDPNPTADDWPASAGAKHARRPTEQQPVPAARHGSRDASAPKTSELNVFDRKAARRLKLGQAEIEARIDLHGMRQTEAHAALRRFLGACHARGQRLVLVITGKGGPARRGDDDGYGIMGDEERGVLKRNVPQWLSEPELRAIVVSYTSAAIHHGGDGAIYVHLRNPERKKRKP